LRCQNDKLICFAKDVKNRARGLGGYDVAFTRRRSPVRIRPSPLLSARALLILLHFTFVT
jgi:hypothetical protein